MKGVKNKFTIRMDELESRWMLTAYEVKRHSMISKGKKPPSLSQFLVGIITDSLGSPEAIEAL